MSAASFLKMKGGDRNKTIPTTQRDDETAERLIEAMAHPVELPDPPPDMEKRLEEGRKAIKKFGGNNNDDESNDAK